MTELLLLDLDDTLYPYAPCNQAGKDAAFTAATERLGYRMDREAFETFYQRGRRLTKQQVDGTAAAHNRYIYFKRAVEHHHGTHRASDAHELAEAYWDAYLDAMELFDDVEQTLDAVHDRGIEIAITTDLTTRIQLRKLDRLGLEDEIDLLWTSEESGRDKPAAAMFTGPIAAMDAHRSETVMVGDSVTSDIAGGNGVGLTTVLVNDSVEPDAPEHRQPDHRIEEFSDVLDILE